MSKFKLSKHPILSRIMHLCPDKWFIRLRWNANMPYRLNLKHPQTFNEKLQWIKLNDRNPLYTNLVDKYKVKQYVTERIGSEHVIPVIGAWDDVESIEWDNLPNQFVIKCSHDCGGMVICKDKSKLDIQAAKKRLKRCMSQNYYWQSREWPYKNVVPKIFAEAYMEDQFGELRDYKWFCFNGEPKAFFIASDRQKEGEETKFDFYDTEFNHLPFVQGHPNSKEELDKPVGFEKMKKLAAKLSKGIPEVRVDFYDVDGKVYFGEFTFFHYGGMTPFEPNEWDYKFGEWIKLPIDK